MKRCVISLFHREMQIKTIMIYHCTPFGMSIIKKSTNNNFIAALFTTAKTWKQPKCPLTEKWVKKVWYVYACHKNNKIMPLATTWMNLELAILSEVSQRKKCHMPLLACGI